jgi:acyl transferase domain-containing protein/phosphopantetheinyl transferase (holo-ACP synthase)
MIVPSSARDQEGVAIVGMSCLLPGADTLRGYWQNIVGKVDCITDPSPDWQPELFLDKGRGEPDKIYAGRGGYLGDLCRFDPLRYGVMPSSLDGAEPDHFIALRCAYEALADAGFPDIPLNRDKTGVIIGRGLFINRGYVTVLERAFVVDQVIGLLRQLEPWRAEEDLSLLKAELKKHLPPASAETVPGLVHSALVGRIANRLDLRGPAYTVDAACAAALVALDQAVQELRSGRCDAVLVGGAQVSTPALIHVMFCYLGALSRTGKIAPFSAEAAGTLLGQGCGVLVLKRLSDAERDGNRIYARVRSVGISSDGKGAGLLAPRTEGQQLAIQRAYEQAGYGPERIGLIEAHATGIPLGDATELKSLQASFGPPSAGADVAMGSVKSMIGHLIPASGAAALIKTALAVYHRVLPPTLNADQPNPKLNLDQSRFYLASEPRPWVHGDSAAPRCAGVNAFGFGGINAHAILEADPASDARGSCLEANWPTELVVVSAADRKQLAEKLLALAHRLDGAEDVSLLDVAYTSAQDTGDSRLTIVASSFVDLVKKTRHAAKLLADASRTKIQDRSGIFWYAEPLAKSGRLAFMFPGEGAQYVNMLGGLCRQFPEVRREFDLTEEAFRRAGRGSLARHLFAQPAATKQAEAALFELEAAVASVTAAERGLMRLMARFGIEPSAIVGHSSGEFAALQAAGVYRPKNNDEAVQAVIDGAEVAAKLSVSQLVPTAGMLAVGGADPQAVAAVLEKFTGQVQVAMDNCPHQAVLVGDRTAIDQVTEALRGKGGLCERLPFERAYHTPAFEPATSIVAEFFDRIELHAPSVELWSCASADRFPADAEGSRELAIRQWCSAVRFQDTVRAMHAADVRLFVEVGPRGNLSSFVTDILGDQPHASVPLDSHRREGADQLCRALGQLAAHGVAINLNVLYERRQPQRVDLTGGPKPAPARQPILPLELPTLKVDAAFAEAHWGKPPEAAPSPIESPVAPVIEVVGPNIPAAATAPDPEPTETWYPAPAAPAPTDRRAMAAVEFQRTMQAFLETQQHVTLARFQAPAPRKNGPEANGNGYGHGSANVSTNGAALIAPAAPVHTNGHAATSTIQATAVKPVAKPVPPAPRPTPAPATRIAPAPQSAPAAKSLPLIGTILERTAERVVAEVEFDLAEDVFLRDHTFFGRGLSSTDAEHTALPIMPLAMTLEVMAEAAALLCPAETVWALSDIRTSRWVTFEHPQRRVRVVARMTDPGRVEAAVFETEIEGTAAEIARATIELTSERGPLGRPTVAEQAGGTPPWKAEDLYGPVLYHGPAFQGISNIERWGPQGVKAAVREPDRKLLFRTRDARQLVLPVTLIDTLSQIPGLLNGGKTEQDRFAPLAFPNTVERLEVGAIDSQATYTALASFHQDDRKLYSDVELVGADGQTVLRYIGRVEELVQFPARLYLYAARPRTMQVALPLKELFAGVPGSEHVAICETDSAVDQLFVRGPWAEVLAGLTLSRTELTEFRRRRLPPVQAVAWLLGRVAAKEALRQNAGKQACLADIEIQSLPSGAPAARGAGSESHVVSLSHKPFYAVAAAGPANKFAGVGIDVEPVRTLDAGLVADSFTDQERALLGQATGTQSADYWLCAGWAAKEAAAKSLGLSLSDPRQARIVQRDGAAGLVVEFDRRDGSPHETLTIHCRPQGDRVIALCLRPLDTSR